MTYLGATGEINRAALARGPRIGVGVHDGLSALIAARHGFDFQWLSSTGMATACGLPEPCLLEHRDRCAVAARVRGLVSAPLVVELGPEATADPLLSFALSRSALRAGADGLCLTCAAVTPVLTGCLRAAAEAFEAEGRVESYVIASIGRLGPIELLSGQIDAGEATAAAGADALLVEQDGPDPGVLAALCATWGRRTPLYVEVSGQSPPPQLVFGLGASHLVFSDHAVRAAHRAVDRVCAELARPGAFAETAGLTTAEEISEEVGAGLLGSLRALGELRA